MTRHHPKLASRVVDNSILALVLAGGDILWHRAWLCRDAHFTQLGIGSSLIAELDAIANIRYPDSPKSGPGHGLDWRLSQHLAPLQSEE